MTAITPEELAARLQAGDRLHLIDTRSWWEFARGHLPGARHLPFWRLMIAPGAPPPDEPILYCGHGPRATMAAWALRLRGGRARLLDGHMSGWYRRRLPVER